MQLNILTPELKVFSGEVDSVQLCGTNGKFEILNKKGYLFVPDAIISNSKDYYWMEQHYIKTIK